MAFVNSDIRGEGSGCVIWFDDLLDSRQMPNAGQDLNVRLDVSEIGTSFYFHFITLTILLNCKYLLVCVNSSFHFFFCQENQDVEGDSKKKMAVIVESWSIQLVGLLCN